MIVAVAQTCCKADMLGTPNAKGYVEARQGPGDEAIRSCFPHLEDEGEASDGGKNHDS